MTEVVHRLEIPNWWPASANKLGGHWGKRRRLKLQDAGMIAAYVRLAEVPKARGKRRVTLTIHIARGRAPDGDNLWKSLLDGLVGCKALVDDGPRWVEVMPVRYERGPRATTVELEDL